MHRCDDGPGERSTGQSIQGLATEMFRSKCSGARPWAFSIVPKSHPASFPLLTVNVLSTHAKDREQSAE